MLSSLVVVMREPGPAAQLRRERHVCGLVV
jgi:hypothetical protein